MTKNNLKGSSGAKSNVSKTGSGHEEKREYHKRSLEELNMIDDFLFGTVLSNTKNGKEAAGIILETVLGHPVTVSNVVAQRVIYPPATGLHAVRLDALVEEGGAEVSPMGLYDLEPENKKAERELLPQRARFIHSRIDGAYFESGKDYDKLPAVWVIFITSFDPFGGDYMVYTIRNRCEEVPEMEYEDGARTRFLYVKGKNGNPPKELVELLEYLADTTKDKACNEKLARIQSFVEQTKADPKVREEFDVFDDYWMSVRREAIAEEREKTAEANKKAEEERKKAEEERKKAEEANIKAEEAEKELKRIKTVHEIMLRNLRDSGMAEEKIAAILNQASAE